MPPKRKSKARNPSQASLNFKKRTPELWDMVTREDREGLYQVTAIDMERQTCTLTLWHGGYATNLEHYRIALATLTCVEK